MQKILARAFLGAALAGVAVPVLADPVTTDCADKKGAAAAKITQDKQKDGTVVTLSIVLPHDPRNSLLPGKSEPDSGVTRGTIMVDPARDLARQTFVHDAGNAAFMTVDIKSSIDNAPLNRIVCPLLQ